MQKSKRRAWDSATLRQRIRTFYRHFNRANWRGCFKMIDPRLRNGARVDVDKYAAYLEHFKEFYGSVQIRYVEVKLVAKVNNPKDNRPFAYVVIFWKDKHQSYHLFRERWIKDRERWFTRVVGLITHEENGKPNDG